MRKETRYAPAKVNLALDILRKRPDGYHDMKMVMQTVSLCDMVTVEEREAGFSLRMEGFDPPEGKKTLEQRAAEAFFEELGRPVPGLAVSIDKQTPAYAGMGGGSADVAALLRILRDTYCPEMSGEVLERIGFRVGSDMPFCVRGGTALAEGRGELLTDLPALPDCWFVICKPNFDIPTPVLFGRVRPDAFAKRPDIDGMAAALVSGNLRGIAERLCNVFEEVLPDDCAEVFAIKQKLLEMGALGAAMSGSGPTVFGIFEAEAAAQRAAEELRKKYQQTYLAKPVKKFSAGE